MQDRESIEFLYEARKNMFPRTQQREPGKNSDPGKSRYSDLHETLLLDAHGSVDVIVDTYL